MKKETSIKDYLDRIDEIILNGISVDLASGEFYEKVDDDLLEQCLRSMYLNPRVWDERGVLRGQS
tara:strand:- start:1149 stop:1343 length:195 start_codon:yes stop_codon:yes gene_type:complete